MDHQQKVQQQQHNRQQQEKENNANIHEGIKSFSSPTSITFTDNRPSTIVQRRQQDIISQSPQVQKALQMKEMINNSPQVKNAIQLQKWIDNSPKMMAEKERMQNVFGNNLNYNNGKGYTVTPPSSIPIQKKHHEEEELQMKQSEEQGDNKSMWALQRAIANTSDNTETAQLKEDNNTGNKSMPKPVMAKMENAFGTDFSNVNISESIKASELGALAYTQGNNIHFAPGQFNPETQKGQELLGHELTHVVQQREGKVQPTTQFKGVGINDDKGLEKEADEMGKKAAEGKEIGKSFSSGDPVDSNSESSIQRFEAPGHEAAERRALTEKRSDGNEFTNQEASMTYFGNWMRDMNQVLVPSFTDIVGSDAAFSLIKILALKKFGREITPELFGYYIPAEHIDNPGGQMADSDFFANAPSISPEIAQAGDDRFNTKDYEKRSSRYTTQQESTEPQTGNILGANIFSVDESGVMAYIRRTNLHVERRLELAAINGRTSEGMVHFGAALHAVEDLFAHSNFVELALNKVLEENPPTPQEGKPGLLPELVGEDRKVQTFSSETDLKDKRRALVTGTFTGLDTMHSIGSEGIKMLREGLGPAGTEEERKAQQALVSACLKKMDKLKNNKEVLDKMKKMSPYAGAIEYVNVSTVYDTLRVIPGINLALFDPIHNYLVNIINEEVLSPLADKLESQLLVTKVQDTPIYKDSKQSAEKIKNSQGKEFSPMQKLTAEATGKKLDPTQNLADANKRLSMISNTPSKVQAAASHTQLAKDHTNSIFFGLAFKLAVEADKMLRDKMIAVWGNASKAKDPAYEAAQKYKAEQAAKKKPDGMWEKVKDGVSSVFDSGPSDEVRLAESRTQKENESLEFGKQVYDKGKKPGQEYNLEELRNNSANRIKAIANTIRAIANSPEAAHKSLEHLKVIMGNHKVDNKQANDWLEESLSSTKNAQYELNKEKIIEELLKEASNFDTASEKIKNSKSLNEREAAYKELVSHKTKLLQSIKLLKSETDMESIKQALAFGPLIVLLDRELATVAPSYTSDQLGRLNSIKPEDKISSTNKTLPVINLDHITSIINKSALKDLLLTSRVIIDHPYDSTWWKPHIINFINQHKNQVIEEINARNSGYANFGGPHTH